MDLLDQIRYEGENTGFDFKAIPYKSDKSEDFLKDVMAMANADLDRDRYIVVGVKHHPNGDRNILGIDDFIDDASYYQLVHSNIEPDLHFEYSYLSIDDKTVGVFRIFNCDNPPYMMKKDGKTLRKGDSYIRKGTSQLKLMRADIDRIFAKRQVVPDLAAKLEAVFEADGKPSTSVTPAMDSGLPSASAARRIRRAIAEKEMTEAQREARRQELQDKTKNSAHQLFNFLDTHPAFAMMNDMAALASGSGTPYEKRDLKTLRQNLETVQDTYREDDLYYLYEERACKINILLSNHGEQYIENCSVEIRIKKAFGLVVAPAIYPKPEKRSQFMPIVTYGPNHEALNYPKVTETEDSYLLKTHLGDLRHNLPTPALKVPARLTLPVNTAGQQVDVTLTLYSRNMPKPYVKKMLIEVV
jgi:hypothetical protein